MRNGSGDINGWDDIVWSCCGYAGLGDIYSLMNIMSKDVFIFLKRLCPKMLQLYVDITII